MITTAEAAAILGVTQQTVREWIRSGRIVGRRVGSRFQVDEQSLVGVVTEYGGSEDAADD